VEPVDFKVAGDRAIVVRFGTEINETINKKVRAMRQLLEQEKIEGVEEVIPTYCTLYVFYDPFKTTPKELIGRLEEIESSADESKLPPPELSRFRLLMEESAALTLKTSRISMV
jgi:allophanate hydrolase subunit 1